MNERGATQNEWFHFDFVLGLGSNLLPCVPAGPDVRVVSGSALAGKVGKIPSQFNASGEAHGLLNWQRREILSNEIAIWSKDPRLNICVRTGAISGVYAIDVDVDDLRSDEIHNIVDDVIGAGMFIRARENSRKFLIPFTMENAGPCPKRRIRLDNNPKGPAIELLADGQQFVAAGSHSSGVRYQWLPSYPTELKSLTLEQVNRIWQVLTSRYATAESRTTESGTSTASATSAVSPESSQLLTTISDQDWSTLIAALRFMLDKVADNDTWSQIGYSLLSLQGSRPVESLWNEFSQKAVGYEEGAPEAWWQAHHRAPTRTDFRHVFSMARKRGWGAVSPPDTFAPVVHDQAKEPADKGLKESTGSDDGKGDAGGGGPGGSDAPDSGGLDVIPSTPLKPIVRLNAANFSAIVDQLEEIIKPEIYTQGAHLVFLTPGHDEDEIAREADSKMLVTATPEFITKRLGEVAQFEKFDKKADQYVITEPSAKHINTLVKLGHWQRLRPLDAIARAPFVRADGGICDTPGYDRKSRVLYIPSAEFPDIPRRPDYSDAAGALARIRGVFHQFPWATAGSEAAFISHVLTEAARLAINKSPMFFYNAPTAGTGKTLLQKSASILAHGNVPALRPWVGDSDEIRKTVYASLLAGDRSLLFDNVPDGVKVRSAELCAAITAEKWSDRKLGESEVRAVPNRAVFSASGNNISPAGDLARRSIIIRLDANTEKLADRRFDIEDIERYLIENRPQLLVDALTIVRAYQQLDERPVTMPPAMPSFEQWSKFVREPLMWLELPDPVETQKREAFEDQENVAAVFELLRARFGSGEFVGVDIAHAAGGISDQNGQLTNALINAGCKEPNSPAIVGYWLRSARDKVYGGYKLVAGTQTQHIRKWQFVKVE
jgi:hypothetical protein